MYDADANAFSSVDVTLTATGAGVIPDFSRHFTSGPSVPLLTHADLPSFLTGSGPDFTGATFLDITLFGNMTDAGGTIGINPGLNFFGECADASCITGAGAAQPLIIVGSVSATPLPTALPLFATGIGAMGCIGWPRKRKT